MFHDPIRRFQRLNPTTPAPREPVDKAVKASTPFNALPSYTRFPGAQYLMQQELKALFADLPFSDAQEREIDRPALAAFERFKVLLSHAYTSAPEAEPA
ncbi:hypothetical protein [Pseudomonas sp. UBA1879]|uniref:hypothetical protein n=1 Tax=Pseudomonas sp. UBA1879 TaxID=1947305 RepID=UPI0025D13CAE|nr:hypothetical protein [Pseudomonas sp. UBA1879]